MDWSSLSRWPQPFSALLTLLSHGTDTVSTTNSTAESILDPVTKCFLIINIELGWPIVWTWHSACFLPVWIQNSVRAAPTQDTCASVYRGWVQSGLRCHQTCTCISLDDYSIHAGKRSQSLSGRKTDACPLLSFNLPKTQAQSVCHHHVTGLSLTSKRRTAKSQ